MSDKKHAKAKKQTKAQEKQPKAQEKQTKAHVKETKETKAHDKKKKPSPSPAQPLPLEPAKLPLEKDLFGAIQEARRCLNCPRPSCVEGCPIRQDIPEFVVALARGNLGEAKSIIDRKSNLPAVCGRVCPHELQCEGHCILNKKGEPVEIGWLERFVADFSFDMHLSRDKLLPKTRGKVAVIGSGPAGLTVAGDLSKQGFSVTVYEALPEPGGVLLYGIPAFRLPKEVVRREIAQMETHGVTFVTQSMAGQDFTVDDLFANGFEAVFIGSGTAVAKEIDIPGKELEGVIQSTYLLRMVTLHHAGQVKRQEVPLREGEDALVIGSGNVAMDTARMALRLGAATVTVVARESREEMTALKAEYEAAAKDGVRFLFGYTPVAYQGQDGRLTGLLVEGLAEGEGSEAPKETRLIPGEHVFLAVGSRPANRIVSTTSGIEVDEHGYVITRQRPYGMTTRRNVFAGGDVVHHPATVVLAMKEAKKVAESIAAYVDAIHLLEL